MPNKNEHGGGKIYPRPVTMLNKNLEVSFGNFLIKKKIKTTYNEENYEP